MMPSDRGSVMGHQEKVSMQKASWGVTEESNFVFLRALAMLGGMVAVLLVPHPPEHRLFLGSSIWAFVVYKALLFGAIRTWPARIRAILLGTTVLDLLFVSLFVWLGGGFESHFYLLFYLLVALTAAHFGPAIGFATAGGASLLYVLASVGGMHHLDWPHLAARVATLFLLGGSLGYLGRRERIARAEAENLNKELEAHQAHLELAYRDLQSAQTRLVQAERLATIGQISAKVSHEVRNPLSSISLNLELLEDELALLPTDRRTEMARLLGAVQSQVDVLCEVTEEYLLYARLPKPKLGMASLRALIASLADFVREEIHARKVELLVDVQGDLPALHVDSGQIRQVLLNLIRNAAEAMPEGGTIRLEARALAPDSTGAEAQRSRGAEKGKSGSALLGSPQRPSAPAPLLFIEVTISDTGVGIPADNLERVFEPFFTNKEGGTGLGLAISRQIAMDHGGTLTCERTSGGGTTFRLHLPVRDGDHTQ